MLSHDVCPDGWAVAYGRSAFQIGYYVESSGQSWVSFDDSIDYYYYSWKMPLVASLVDNLDDTPACDGPFVGHSVEGLGHYYFDDDYSWMYCHPAGLYMAVSSPDCLTADGPVYDEYHYLWMTVSPHDWCCY